MKGHPCTGFYVRFLGGFSLSYRGREIRFNANPQNISMQMLMMLLKAGEEGVERKDLLAMIRPDEKDQKKRQNNFRQQIHILRRMTANADLPKGSYVLLKGSRYHFTQEYEVRTDTQRLDRLVEKIKNETLEKGDGWEEAVQVLYREYCQAYTGEFLPMLGAEEWVTAESAFYQKWYFICLNKRCAYLREQGRYETMLELSTTAAHLHPYDEWQAVQIECLMALDRYREALEIYEEATEIFYKDLGVTSLDKVMARYRGPGKEQAYATNVLTRLKQDLEEKEKSEEGPYYCSYPSFQDIYRLMARLAERAGTKDLLLLCTLLEDPEPAADLADASKELEQKMLRLKKVLIDGTRTGDIYTRYSQNQYLALLAGAGEEEGKLVIERLREAWEQQDKEGRTEVRFAFQEVESAALAGAEGPAIPLNDKENIKVKRQSIKNIKKI